MALKEAMQTKRYGPQIPTRKNILCKGNKNAKNLQKTQP